MLASEVISRVRGIIGDTNSLQFTDAQLLDWINEGIRQCALKNNLLQKTASQATVASQDNYSLPTDILKLHSIKYNKVKLDVLTMQQFDDRYTPDNSGVILKGTPETCYIWAGKVIFYPVPATATDTIRIDYTYTPALIAVAATEIPLPVGYHQRIVDYTLAMVAQQDDDMNKYQLKMQEFETGVVNLKDQDEWTYDMYPLMGVSTRDMGGYSNWDTDY